MAEPTLDQCIAWWEPEADAVPAAAPYVAATLAALLRLKAVEEALKTYDAAMTDCPVNNPKRGRNRDRPNCSLCGATTDQGCGMDARASYSLITTIRATLTETNHD